MTPETGSAVVFRLPIDLAAPGLMLDQAFGALLVFTKEDLKHLLAVV